MSTFRSTIIVFINDALTDNYVVHNLRRRRVLYKNITAIKLHMRGATFEV